MRGGALIAISVALLVALTPSPASAAVTSLRLDGPDRYGTAVEISKAEFPGGAADVVIATGLNFPDALTGGCIGAVDGAPMLLVSGTVPSVVKNEIIRLGATKAIILGGEEAVSADVEATLHQDLGLQIERIGGADRYETARLIAEYLDTFPPGIGGWAVIATGGNFPDSLAATPMSGWFQMPILLVKPNSIPPATEHELADLGIQHTIVVGGSAVVANSVYNQLPDPMRLGGANRYDTMRAIGEAEIGWGMGGGYMALATGENFPDALAGGVRVARSAGVLVLTRPDVLVGPARALLLTQQGTLPRLEALGGTKVITTHVFADAIATVE